MSFNLKFPQTLYGASNSRQGDTLKHLRNATFATKHVITTKTLFKIKKSVFRLPTTTQADYGRLVIDYLGIVNCLFGLDVYSVLYR